LRTEHGEVSCRIAPHNDRGDTSAIYERDARILDAMHNVLVGQDVAVWGYDDSRTGAASRTRGLTRAPNIDAYDRRSSVFHCTDDRLGVGIEGVVRKGVCVFDRFDGGVDQGGGA
jgi:hypothetical protein